VYPEGELDDGAEDGESEADEGQLGGMLELRLPLLCSICAVCLLILHVGQIFKLDQEDFDALSRVHEEPGKLLHLCNYDQGDIQKTKKIFGWTFEEMGWDPLD
jgi:hypothetical protein